MFFYVLGLLICALGVSLLFHTYITPEAYELYVKEISKKTGRKIHVVKTIYDCCSCLAAVIMSFCFFGPFVFEGVKAGTVICAIVNGWVIGKCNIMLEKMFEFKDAFKWRHIFSE